MHFEGVTPPAFSVKQRQPRKRRQERNLNCLKGDASCAVEDRREATEETPEVFTAQRGRDSGVSKLGLAWLLPGAVLNKSMRVCHRFEVA